MPSVLSVGRVMRIKRDIALREEYLRRARALSNAAISNREGVHVRTIDNISAGRSHKGVQVDEGVDDAE